MYSILYIYVLQHTHVCCVRECVGAWVRACVACIVYILDIYVAYELFLKKRKAIQTVFKHE